MTISPWLYVLYLAISLIAMLWIAYHNENECTYDAPSARAHVSMAISLLWPIFVVYAMFMGAAQFGVEWARARKAKNAPTE